MSTGKRKRDNIDEDDEDEPSFGRQILPVAYLPEDFNGEPTDGMQYLFTVRRDARKLPRITRVANPYDVPEVQLEPRPPALTGPHPALPLEEWRAVFLYRFKNMRMNSIRPAIGVDPRYQRMRVKMIPEKKERDNWWAFISGRPECVWNPPKKPKKSRVDHKKEFAQGMRAWSDEVSHDDAHDSTAIQETYHINDQGEVELAVSTDHAESLPTPSNTPRPQGQVDEQIKPEYNTNTTTGVGTLASSLVFRQPTPTLLSFMDSRYCLHLLMYFSHWMDRHLEQPYPPSSQMTETHARWIFTLLTRVDEHLSSDEISQLRTLARSCLSFIKESIQRLGSQTVTSRQGENSEEAPMGTRACWMIITAIAGFWRQSDLWVDAETMLSSA